MEEDRIRKKSKLSSQDPAGEKDLNPGNSSQNAQLVCNDSHDSLEVSNSRRIMVDKSNGQTSDLSSPDPTGVVKELNSVSSSQNAQRMLVDEIVKRQKSRLPSIDPAGAEEDLSAENISQSALRLWNLSGSQDSCELAILLLQACISTAASHFATYFRNIGPDLRPTLDTLVRWTLISTSLALLSLEEQWDCGEFENPNGDEDNYDKQIPAMEESANSSEPILGSESLSDSNSLHSFDQSLDDLLQQLEDTKNEVLLIEESTRMDGDDDLLRQEAKALRWEMDHPRPRRTFVDEDLDEQYPSCS